MVRRSTADLIGKAIKLRGREQVATDFDQMIKRSLGVAGRFSSVTE